MPGELSKTQRRLVGLLSTKGPLRGQQIDRQMPRVDWRSAARSLIRGGLVTTEPVLPSPKVKPKLGRTAQLACPVAEAEAALPGLGRSGSKALERRQAILRFLIREPGPVDVSWVYAESGGSLEDLRALSERGLVRLGEVEVWRDPLQQYDFQPSQPPVLTHDQQAVWAEVELCLEQAAAGRAVSAGAAAWRDRLGKDRDLPARRAKDAGERQAGDRAGARDCPDPADRAALCRAVFPGRWG